MVEHDENLIIYFNIIYEISQHDLWWNISKASARQSELLCPQIFHKICTHLFIIYPKLWNKWSKWRTDGRTEGRTNGHADYYMAALRGHNKFIHSFIPCWEWGISPGWPPLSPQSAHVADTAAWQTPPSLCMPGFQGRKHISSLH